LISFPNAKINIGLNVIEKRPDGFHNLESIFIPILGLYDVLEVIPLTKNEKLQFESSGLQIGAKTTDNLVIKAYNLLKNQFALPPVKIHLHKIIPSGAGLGGGSSDAAFMLKMLNEMFKLSIETPELLSLAEQLGSDCPFFIENECVYVTEKGQIMEKVDFFLPTSYFVIVKPPIHVPTKDAFANIIPQKPEKSLLEIIGKLPKEWKNFAKNDFETTVFEKYPEIEKIKNELYHLGAEFASMTGSGSAVFGIFPHQIDLKNQFPNCFLWSDYIRFIPK